MKYKAPDLHTFTNKKFTTSHIKLIGIYSMGTIVLWAFNSTLYGPAFDVIDAHAFIIRWSVVLKNEGPFEVNDITID